MPEKVKTIRDATLPELHAAYSKAKTNEAKWKHQKACIGIELVRRFGDRLKEILTRKDKEHGSATDTIEGEKLKLDIKQTVKWDSAKLLQIGETFGVDVAQKILKMDLSVPEATFNAITDDALKNALIEARTVEIKAPTIVFVGDDE